MADAGSPSRLRGVRIDLSLDRQLEEIAARKFSTPSQIIREAVAQFARREQRAQRREDHDDGR